MGATESESVTTREAFVSGLSNAALHCRELGHTWRSWTVTYDAKAKCYDRRLRCSSCKTFRNELLDRTGDVIRSSYTYAAGYLAKNVDGKVHRSLFRLESLGRFIETHETGGAPAPVLKAVS